LAELKPGSVWEEARHSRRSQEYGRAGANALVAKGLSVRGPPGIMDPWRT